MEDCLFCMIAEGKIPSKKLYEDDQVVAFYDINPQAKVHFLVVPKKHIQSAAALTEEDGALLGHIFAVIAKLAKEGFYDGLTFHRIEPGFVIQGGDPNGNGTGGPGYQIKGEFSANGVENTISHVRGVVSMARAQDYDSAGSQFFITLDDATFLDGQYAAFGTVDEESMKVVDAIVEQYLQDGKAPVMKSVTVE